MQPFTSGYNSDPVGGIDINLPDMFWLATVLNRSEHTNQAEVSQDTIARGAEHLSCLLNLMHTCL